MCEGIREAVIGGRGGGPERGAEEPDGGMDGCGGGELDARKGVIGWETVLEEGDELGELVGEVVLLRAGASAAEGSGLDGAAARSAANAEIDAVGIEGFEGGKDFSHLEGGVVRQHDAAGAEANVAGFSADAGEHDLGRGTGEGVHGVVLGHPEAMEAEGVDVAGERDGVGQGLRGRGAARNGRLVEDGKALKAHRDWM